MKTSLLTALLALVLSGCGGSSSPASTPQTAAEPPVADIAASADPQVQYFHEQLVANGEDLQSDFGGYLSSLDMNPRDLQQDDPKHAYDTVLEKVQKVQDPALKREMMQTFFNAHE